MTKLKTSFLRLTMIETRTGIHELVYLHGRLKSPVIIKLTMHVTLKQAQKARLEARMATAQINQKMHDIAEARWKMLPIAVQREHEILGD